MPLGKDTQYDLSWEEQDKIRRRLDLKDRLKQEGVRKRYDPFLQIKKIIFDDPAVDRYMDLRKKGRMPHAPFHPKVFFGGLAWLTVPLFIGWRIVEWERAPYIAACESGDIPYSKRPGKAKT